MDKLTCAILTIVALVAMVVCILACAGFAAIAYLSPNMSGQTHVQETTASKLIVDSPATLLVRNPVGNVTIQADDQADGIEIEATKEAHSIRESWAEGLLEQIDVQITKEDDARVRVAVTLPEESQIQRVSVNLLITVPERVDLDVVNEAGHVRIVGTEGDVRVRSEAGNLHLEGVTITNQCDIMNVTGDIDFQGPIPETGAGEQPWEMLLRTETGDIAVAVPSDSRFTLNAETDTGGIDCKFEVEEMQSGQTQNNLGRWLRGGVNQSPAGKKVILRTETGNITIEPLP